MKLSTDTDAWLKAVSRSFARRLVQEAAMDVRYVPVIPMLDEPVHTDESPICQDVTCPCRGDIAALKQAVFDPFFNGLLTVEEVNLLLDGKNI